jgi:hypothetical protein
MSGQTALKDRLNTVQIEEKPSKNCFHEEMFDKQRANMKYQISIAMIIMRFGGISLIFNGIARTDLPS